MRTIQFLYSFVLLHVLLCKCTVDGMCKGLPSGKITIELKVMGIVYYKQGEAVTTWSQSATVFIVEEVHLGKLTDTGKGPFTIINIFKSVQKVRFS